MLTTPGEVAQVVARLEADVASGRIEQVIADAVRAAGDVGDYLFVVAERTGAEEARGLANVRES